MRTVTLYTPNPPQREVHLSNKRFKVVNFGRRSGKSTMAQNYILHPAPLGSDATSWPIQGAFSKVGRYWIVAPTYQQAKSVYWRGLMFSDDDSNSTAIPKQLIKEVNNSDLIITLINGSTIELKGSDNPDSLRGAEAAGVVLDEYAFWANPDAWEYVIRPMLSTTNGWAMFISTPNGYNHFYEMAEHAKITECWSYHTSTIWDNPHVPEDEKLRLRDELDNDTFAQEYLAEFRKMKGLVYPEFKSDIHIYDGTKIKPPVGGTWALGVDPGTSNALAAVFIFIDYENNWWLTDELYERGLPTDQIARLLTQKMGGNYFGTRVVDSQAAQFILDMNSIHSMGLVPVKKLKDSIQEGIRLNRELLKVQEGTGKPKFFVADHCRNFIREIESYRYPDKKDGSNEKEDPIKENDHLMDAWRYVRLALNIPQRRAEEKKERIYHPVTGRIMS